MTEGDVEKLIDGRHISAISNVIQNKIRVSESDVVYVPEIEHYILVKIAEFCEYHSRVPIDHVHDYNEIPISDWRRFDVDFCADVLHSGMNSVVCNAAKYLNIRPLLELLVLYLARQISGMDRGMEMDRITRFFIEHGMGEVIPSRVGGNSNV